MQDFVTQFRKLHRGYILPVDSRRYKMESDRLVRQRILGSSVHALLFIHGLRLRSLAARNGSCGRRFYFAVGVGGGVGEVHPWTYFWFVSYLF